VIPIKVNIDRYNRSHPDNDNILPGVFGMVAGDGIWMSDHICDEKACYSSTHREYNIYCSCWHNELQLTLIEIKGYP